MRYRDKNRLRKRWTATAKLFIYFQWPGISKQEVHWLDYEQSVFPASCLPSPLPTGQDHLCLLLRAPGDEHHAGKLVSFTGKQANPRLVRFFCTFSMPIFLSRAFSQVSVPLFPASFMIDLVDSILSMIAVAAIRSAAKPMLFHNEYFSCFKLNCFSSPDANWTRCPV